MVQSHSEVFVPVMTSTQQQPLTLEEFKQLFTVCYSHPDSQLRAAEEVTAGHWETVLTLVSGKNEMMGVENPKAPGGLFSGFRRKKCHKKCCIRLYCKNIYPPYSLSDAQANFSFEDLLTFITGGDHLPPLGLPRLISLCFYSQVGIYQITISLDNVNVP